MYSKKYLAERVSEIFGIPETLIKVVLLPSVREVWLLIGVVPELSNDQLDQFSSLLDELYESFRWIVRRPLFIPKEVTV